MPTRRATAGDHVFVVYEDAAELYAFVVPYFKDGLAKGERCIFLCAESNPAATVKALAAHGLRIGSEVQRGGVVVIPALEFFGPPPLDAAGAIRAILQAHTQAIAAGFAGLRAAGDWGWTRPGDGDEFRELESLLERTVGPGRPRVACLYRRDRADPDGLERLIRLNRRVVANDHVFVSLSPVFRGLHDKDLRQLTRSARARTLRRGEFFFHQGAPAKDVFLLTSGLVKLVRTAPGGEEVILRVVPPVQHFGDGRIGLEQAIRFASAEALEESRALAWDSTVIAQVVVANPEAGVRVIRWLEQLMEEERRRLEDFLSSDVKLRLARLILRLGESIGRKTRRGLVIDVPLSRRDLADLVITSPYTVSRILAEWRRRDILDAQRTRIRIQDRDSLAAIAEQHVDAPRADARIS